MSSSRPLTSPLNFMSYARIPVLSSRDAFSIMKKLANFTIWLSIVVAAVLIPLYSIDLYRHGRDKDYIAYFSAGAFVLLTFPISIRQIYLHLTHWFMPNIQRSVVRILWMVPLYSIESFLSLRYHDISIYFQTARESYESYVIYSFFCYLVSLLGEEDCLISLLESQPSSSGHHPMPISWFLSDWTMGRDFYNKCKYGVLQYVILKNLSAIITLILTSLKSSHTGDFNISSSYLWISLIANISQIWAMYCLIFLYFSCANQLAKWNPVPKFLCVKAVVFFTFWQSLILSALLHSGILTSTTHWSGVDIAAALNDYIICIEMFFASIAHHISFSYKQYDPSNHYHDIDQEELVIEMKKQPFLKAFWQSSIPHDVLTDVKQMLKWEHKNNKDDEDMSGIQSDS